MGKMIDIAASDGHRLGAYRSEPAGTPRGALIVVQEIFGVNQHVKKVTDAYAADGYVAIAPAFFDRLQRNVELGYAPADRDAGRSFTQKLDWQDIIKDVQAAFDSVKPAGKVGIVGYCWGGTVAWASSSRIAGLACAVPYYGGGISGMLGDKPKCPTMCHWGENDQSIPLTVARSVEAAYPEVISHIYATTGHGFNCDERDSYNAVSAALARERTLEFLRKHLG
jgi:carboxymethylenebutenolidase